MNRFQRILQPETKAPPRALLVDGRMRTLAQLRSDMTTLDMGRLFGTGETGDYTNDDIVRMYKRCATAYIAVNARASFASGIQGRVTDGNGQVINGSPAQSFLDDSQRLIFRALVSWLVHGGIYFRKYRNQYGYPTRIEWLNPLDVKPEVDAATQTIKAYRVASGRGYEFVKPDDIITERAFNPTSDVDGLSAVEVAFIRCGIEINIGQFGSSFFGNGARPDGMLTFEGELDKEQQDKARTYWQTVFKGARNAFKTAIMGGTGKWTWQAVNANPVDLAMVDLSTQADMKICAIIGVHPALVGLSDVTDQLSASSTYDSIRQRQIQNTAIPDASMVFDALNNQWLHKDFPNAPYKWTLEPDTDDLTADALGTGERATTAGAAVTNHIWGVNDARKYTGKEPLESHIDRNPDWALNVYNAGLVTRNKALALVGLEPAQADSLAPSIETIKVDVLNRQLQTGGISLNEWRRAMGHNPLPTGDVFYIPAASIQVPIDQIGLMQPKPSYQPFGNPQVTPFEAAQLANGIVPPPPPEPPTNPAVPARSLDTAAALYELNLWRSKVKKHGWNVTFKAEILAPELVTFVRSSLSERWQPSIIFDTAKDAIRANRQPAPLGADAAEAADYWRAFDELKADLGAAWADYQRSIANDLLTRALDDADLPDTLFAHHHRPLWDAWIGAADKPGILTKLLIAGGAAGDVMLQRNKALEPGVTRAAAITVDWSLISKEALDFAEHYGFDLIKGIDDTTRNEVKAIIQRGVSDGLSRDDLTELLNGTLSGDRVTTRATSIAQTESIRAYNEGSFNRWTQAGVTEAEWQTVRDTHVCPRCASVHGTRAKFDTGWRSTIDGETLRPPRHPNCRCFTRPIV